MNNEVLQHADTQSKNMFSVIDAQRAINTMLEKHVLSPVHSLVMSYERSDVTQNYVNLDTHQDFIDASELHTARIFPKRNTSSKEITVEYKKLEKTLFAIACKVKVIIQFWSKILFQKILEALTAFDVLVESYMQRSVVPQVVQQPQVQENIQEVTAHTQVKQKAVVHALKIQKYEANTQSVAISYRPKEIAYVQPVPEDLEYVQLVKKKEEYTLLKQTVTRQVKKRSTFTQVLAILTAEILYGKRLGDIDSI